MTRIFQFLGTIFIPYPYAALLPALLFGFLYLKSKSTTVLVTAIIWVLYSIYEELHLLRVVCSGECNIRIDLFLMYPVLIVVSAIALVIGIKHFTKSN